MIRTVAIATAIGLILTGGPCVPEGKSAAPSPTPSRKLNPIAQALADLPVLPPPPGLAPNGRKNPLRVVFRIEVAKDRGFKRQLEKRAGLKATAWTATGQVPTVTDPKTGETLPASHVISFTTPHWYEPELDPGIVAISIQVVYPLGRAGEWVRCYAVVRGERVTGTEHKMQVASAGRENGFGTLAVVVCTYIESSPAGLTILAPARSRSVARSYVSSTRPSSVTSTR